MVFRTQAPNYTVISDCVLKRATFLCYGVHNSARRNIHNTVLAGNMKDFCLASSLVQFIPCQFHGGNLRLGGGAEILETGGGGGGEGRGAIQSAGGGGGMGGWGGGGGGGGALPHPQIVFKKNPIRIACYKLFVRPPFH